MLTAPSAFILSRDLDLVRSAVAYAASQITIRHLENVHRLEPILGSAGPSLLLVDLRMPDILDSIATLCHAQPDHLIIVFGSPRSDPVREAESMGVYATEDLELDRLHFQSLLSHALDRLHLQQEIRILRESPSPSAPPPLAAESSGGGMPLHHFSQALRRFDNPKALLDSVVEGVASTAKVSRVGLFAQVHDTGPYRLTSGLRCLEESRELEFDAHHPLVRWMEINAHLVARHALDHVPDIAHRLLLKQVLDSWGAEILIPLFAHGRMMGWLFLGQRSTGIPFSRSELEDLTVLADHISITFENAKLYEEVALQKTLAETLFQSIPIGIVAVDADGYVRWFNNAAGEMLKLPVDSVLNQAVGVIGSLLADHLHRAYLGEDLTAPREWQHPQTHRFLSAQTHRLMDKDQRCLGAVALIHDLTDARKFREKQDQLERATFWTDLAASMSHEIRNPLVAIKTFAQLLPERYDDPEFRAEFSKLVALEVDQLNKIIEQINSFANPPHLEVKPVDIKQTLAKAIDEARHRYPQEGIRIDTNIDGRLPSVVGDEFALSECLAHLLVNSMEALQRKDNAWIRIEAKPWMNGDSPGSADGFQDAQPAGVMVTVRDNGQGIASDIQEKLFSPFCTTKARGMGLGLPIAKRAAVDHNGHLEIESDKDGTAVTLILPKAPASQSDRT